MIGSIDYMEEHIKEMIEENEDVEYDITYFDYKDIIDNVFDNEAVWEVINDAIEYELSKYEKEEE